jgi:hypothetical protein
MSRISKSNTYAIRWLDYTQKSPDDIAAELKLNVQQVKDVLEKYGRSDGNVPITQQPVSRVRKMLSSTSNKNHPITVMTSEASIAIEASKNNKPSTKDQQSYIYRPNG